MISVVVGLSVLAFFKYLNFFVGSAVDVLRLLSPSLERPTLAIALPAGISFYTFQTMSYSIDVYRGLIPTPSGTSGASRVRFDLSRSSWPARSCARAGSCRSSRKITCAEWTRIARGSGNGAVGLLLEDLSGRHRGPGGEASLRHAGSVRVGRAHHRSHGLRLQIYGDFAGYSLIAIGLGRVMGVDFGINFNRPYFAQSFSEFWSRWHISLSTWLRDYLYIPLGGNRGGSFQTARNMMITMFLGGLWHGASWNFVLWGLLHGFYLVTQRLISPFWQRLVTALRIPGVVVAALEIVTVFTLTCFAWIFFRAHTFADARRIIEIILEFRDLKLHMSEQLIAIAKTGLIGSVVFAVDALSARESVKDGICRGRRCASRAPCSWSGRWSCSAPSRARASSISNSEVSVHPAVKFLLVFVLAGLIGDRAGGALLYRLVSLSNHHYVELYLGKLPAEIVIIGNSRAADQFPPA